MKIVLEGDEYVAAWVAAQLPYVRRFEDAKTIGVADDNDRLIAAVVYHNYYPLYRSIEVGVASTGPGWMQRGIIRAMLHYPFVQLDCQRLTGVTPKRNKKTRKLAEGLGFKLEGVVRRGFGDDDACIYGLLRHEAACWLGEEDAVRQPGSATGA